MNLKQIFDPDYIAQVVRRARYGIDVHDLRVEDLDSEWRIEFEERAGLMEFDGGLTREHAEAEALKEIAQRYIESRKE